MGSLTVSSNKTHAWGAEFDIPNGSTWDNGTAYLRLPSLRLTFEWCDERHNPRVRAVEDLVKSLTTKEPLLPAP